MTDSLDKAGALPKFKYHPDPITTGSIIRSSLKCTQCQLIRGWTYAGPIYGRFDDEPVLCPWCIADETAHQLLGAEFVDPLGVGGYGDWDAVAHTVIEEICFRTPSFNGWQQEKWYTHCNDAAVFVGCAGRRELEALDRAAHDFIKSESGYTDKEWALYFNRLDIDRSPTAYLFRCRHCNSWGGYSDCD
ncbi:MAG TPA: CbrC family protein [Terracidiphilus sp.]|nr:CbrC family protein [Terracidiphilus sp.]